MSYEDKFRAAVNVIRNLPKNGAYQPSHELMLRFYAYYKQATEGSNTMPKPGFWEVIKKAKWDAWKKLGNMSREQAMINYVEELKKIVETMAYTDNVASFITSLDSFYETVPPEDWQLLLGPVIDKVCSQPGSPLSGSPLVSREASPQRVNNKPPAKHITSSIETSPASSYSASPLPPETDEEEEEDFLDTFEQTETESSVVKEPNSSMKNNIKIYENPYKAMNGNSPVQTAEKAERGRQRDRNVQSTNGHAWNMNNISRVFDSDRVVEDHTTDKYSAARVMKSEPTNNFEEISALIINKNGKSADVMDISEAITQTLCSLRKDLNSLNNKVIKVERHYMQITKCLDANESPLWWPLKGVPIPAAVFFVLWPFIVQLLILWVKKAKKV